MDRRDGEAAPGITRRWTPWIVSLALHGSMVLLVLHCAGSPQTGARTPAMVVIDLVAAETTATGEHRAQPAPRDHEVRTPDRPGSPREPASRAGARSRTSATARTPRPSPTHPGPGRAVSRVASPPGFSLDSPGSTWTVDGSAARDDPALLGGGSLLPGLAALPAGDPGGPFVGRLASAPGHGPPGTGTAMGHPSTQHGPKVGPDDKAVSRARPPRLIYPRRDAEERPGEVFVMLVTIDKKGYIDGARLVQGINRHLDEKALRAVWRFRYQPALDDAGNPIEYQMLQRFMLD